ncbi:MAG: hypothetical protein LVQ95_01645 [Candidatus Micrarchaeales archaeon]|nr:hypothetical protein [Candidatus Micrarchaeales archaeon]
MEKQQKEKKQGKPSVQFVKLVSLADLARNATTFSDSARPIFAMKAGSSYRLFDQGPKAGDARIIFYVESKSSSGFLCYKPAGSSDKEVAELRETVSFTPQGSEMHSIPIIEIKQSPFEEKKSASAMNVAVTDYTAIIKGTITKSLSSESIGKVYAFKSGNKAYIGTFSLIEEEEDLRVFCYAQIENGNAFAFYRYNYQTDKVEQTDVFGEHQYLYVRVINLAQPFSFFKE